MWDFSRFENRIAVSSDSGQALTYSDLNDIGEALSAHCDKRCLVFNMCANTLGSLVGYVSFLNKGIVPVMLRHDIDEKAFSNLYELYSPAFIWAPKTDMHIRVYNDFTIVYEAYDYVLMKTPDAFDAHMHPDLALLLTTSGSTGSPKFVRQSYRNIRSNTDSIIDYLHLGPDERPITTLPMNYTYGLSIINTHLDVGSTILLTDKTIMQKEFWDFFNRGEASSFGGVPYTYEMLSRLRFFEMDLPSLRSMTQAGGKLQPELHRAFAEFAINTGREFTVMYGACEATARMGWLPPENALAKSGSMGIAIPGGRLELVDDKDTVVASPNETGELVYYGDNVALGYARNLNDLLLGDEWHGRYKTGDMAKKDDDGYFYIVGRKKRFLKLYGNRVNLDECETFLKESFPECEIACGGVDDCIYIYSPNTVFLSEMKRLLSSKTKINSSAFETIFVEKIPHKENGKIDYEGLKKFSADSESFTKK